MSKAQTISQVFIFMIAAITFAAILFFGYKAVTQFTQKGEQVELIAFKTDLESAVGELATKYGSVRVREFTLPATYEQICFVDMKKGAQESLQEYDPLAYNFWKDKTGQNVFLTPAAVEITLEGLVVEQGYLCLKIQKGAFKVRLEGLGDGTLIGVAKGGKVVGEGKGGEKEPGGGNLPEPTPTAESDAAKVSTSDSESSSDSQTPTESDDKKFKIEQLN